MKRSLLLLALGLAPIAARADVPPQINFQAKFAATGLLPDMEFRLVDSPLSDAGLYGWTESTRPYTASGHVNILLGQQSPLPRQIFSDANTERYLWIKIGAEPPVRQRITAVPYAFQASLARELAGGTTVQGTLSVGGTVRSSAGGFVFPDGSVQTSAASPGGGVRASDAVTWTAPHTWQSSATFQNGGLSVGGSDFVVKNDKVGIGVANPDTLLHVGGNMFMEGGGEQEIRMRRNDLAHRPTFKVGRIIHAGDGDPEFRFVYSDDVTPERTVLEFDKKGILASVKPSAGSHFEGFFGGEAEPLFRINSFPQMQFEMGAGGNSPPDAALRRVGPNALAFFNRADGVTPMQVETVRIDAAGRMGVGVIPGAKLHVWGGDMAVTSTGNGVILKAVDGPNCFKFTVNNSGALSSAPVACP